MPGNMLWGGSKEFLLSFIIPVYNGERYIEECVENVMQNEPNSQYEVIIVNDGSSDYTAQVCRKLCGRYENIRFIDRENGGVSSARNVGLSMAVGKYVSFVDVDDIVAGDFVETVQEFDKKEEFDIIFFRWERIYRRERTWCNRDVPKPIYYEKDKRIYLIQNLLYPLAGSLGNSTLFSPWGKAVRTGFLRDSHILFDESMSIAEDVKWNVECLANMSRCIYCPMIVYGYYCNQGSSGSKYREDAAAIGMDANEKIENALGRLLELPEIRRANAYSILYRYWWCVVADFYHVNNRDSVRERARRMKDLKAEPCYKMAFGMLDREMFRVMDFNQKLIMKLVDWNLYLVASMVCQVRIYLKRRK